MTISDGPLTAAEMRVLRRVAEGMTNKEIAGAEGIAEATVLHHMTGILRKLGVDYRTEALVAAIRAGLIDIDGNDPTYVRLQAVHDELAQRRHLLERARLIRPRKRREFIERALRRVNAALAANEAERARRRGRQAA